MVAGMNGRSVEASQISVQYRTHLKSLIISSVTYKPTKSYMTHYFIRFLKIHFKITLNVC